MFKEKVAARWQKMRNSEIPYMDKLRIYLMLEQLVHGGHCALNG
jgi:hypothetical protein